MNISELQSNPPVFKQSFKRATANASQACKMFQKTGLLFYRGLENYTLPVGEADAPHNRLPRNSPVEWQTVFDKKLSEAGFNALRSNSIFCSGSYAQARQYGRIYAVFPFNGFTYTWSPKLRDMFIDSLALIEDTFDIKLPRLQFWSKNNINLRNEVLHLINEMSPKTFIDVFGFKQTGIEEALESFSEIYIHGHYLQFDCILYEHMINLNLNKMK